MDSSTHWEHETQLPNEPLSASRARAFVCQHLVEHRLLQLVDPIRVVVSELATSAIVHADAPFTVTLSMTDDTVVLSVQDDSSAALADPVTEVSGPHADASAIVGILSEQWGVDTDPRSGKTVWAKFPRPRPPTP
jgi:hypothetical protein